MINVAVADPAGRARAPEVADAVASKNQLLAGHGRVLIRPSGTEPVVRVMVEAPTGDEAERSAERLAAALRAAG